MIKFQLFTRISHWKISHCQILLVLWNPRIKFTTYLSSIQIRNHEMKTFVNGSTNSFQIWYLDQNTCSASRRYATYSSGHSTHYCLFDYILPNWIETEKLVVLQNFDFLFKQNGRFGQMNISMVSRIWKRTKSLVKHGILGICNGILYSV